MKFRIPLLLVSLLALASNSSHASFTQFDDDWQVLAGGALIAGAGDTFAVGYGFYNGSTQNTVWNTTLSTLLFQKSTGNPFGDPPVAPNTSGDHQLVYPGLNLGDTTYAGYTNNFSWDTVNVVTGNQLLTSGGGALYTRALVLGGGISQIASFTGDMIIYYDINDARNSYLAGATYSFGSGGGEVAPVPIAAPIPEPSSVLFGIFAGGIAAGSGFSWCRKKAKKA